MWLKLRLCIRRRSLRTALCLISHPKALRAWARFVLQSRFTAILKGLRAQSSGGCALLLGIKARPGMQALASCKFPSALTEAHVQYYRMFFRAGHHEASRSAANAGSTKPDVVRSPGTESRSTHVFSQVSMAPIMVNSDHFGPCRPATVSDACGKSTNFRQLPGHESNGLPERRGLLGSARSLLEPFGTAGKTCPLMPLVMYRWLKRTCRCLHTWFSMHVRGEP